VRFTRASRLVRESQACALRAQAPPALAARILLLWQAAAHLFVSLLPCFGPVATVLAGLSMAVAVSLRKQCGAIIALPELAFLRKSSVQD